MQEPQWTVRVVLESPGRVEAELVADRLWSFGARAVLEEPSTGGDPEAVAALVAGFESEAAAFGAVDGIGRGQVEAVADDGWADRWRDHARAVRVGRVVILPAWLDDPPGLEVAPPLAPRPDEVRVSIDPGRAFGSGMHPTTRLVLAEVERLVRPGASVLDVGCGSGVLAVSAARLGAARVVGVDIDPEARRATAENAERNHVAVTVGDQVDPEEHFDLVLANLLAPTLRELSHVLRRAVAPHGALVLSGLLHGQWPTVRGKDYEDWGVDVLDRLEGWDAVTLARLAPLRSPAPPPGRDA